MICKWCNQQNPENNKFCMNCGKELTNNNLYNNNLNNQQNTQNYYQNNSTLQTEEKANIGLAILSWFIPLAGLIIFIIKKEKQPKTAKLSGTCALISFILNLIIVGICIFLFSSFFNTIWDEEINNTINDLWSEDYNTNNDNYDNSINNDNLDENVNNENTETTNNNWKKYQVIVNNKTLTLPTTYNDIKTATNASIKSADEKSYLSSNYYTLANMYKDNKLALYIELTNESNTDLLYTDCQVTRISQTKYQISNGAEVITFPGGLTAGKEITETEIIGLFGTPYDTNEYSNDGYESKTYTYVENTTWTTTNNYKIKVVNGIIDEITLDNR